MENPPSAKSTDHVSLAEIKNATIPARFANAHTAVHFNVRSDVIYSSSVSGMQHEIPPLHAASLPPRLPGTLLLPPTGDGAQSWARRSYNKIKTNKFHWQPCAELAQASKRSAIPSDLIGPKERRQIFLTPIPGCQADAQANVNGIKRDQGFCFH